MKELINSIFSTSKERVSNPIIGTFIISSIVFNWKAVLLLLFSNKTMEDKIIHISKNYNSISTLLIYPLITIVIYLLVIPHLSLLFEYLLEFSRIKKNKISIKKQKQLIENKTELAIDEIKFEEAQAKFKERENENKLIDNLQNTIQDKEEQLLIERDRYVKLSSKIKDETIFLNKRFDDQRKIYEDNIKSLQKDNQLLAERFSNHKKESDSILRNYKDLIDSSEEEKSNQQRKKNIEILEEFETRKRKNNRLI